MPALPSLGGFRGRTLRVSAKNHPPLPVPLSAYVVDCAVYVAGARLDGRWTHTEAINEVRKRRDGFVWIGLHEPNEEQIQGIAETFGLHQLAVEDAVQAHQRPKLDTYDNALFMVFKPVRYVAHESPTTASEIVETGEVMAFVGKDFIVTVRHGNHSGLATVRHQLEQDPETLAAGPAAVLHAIADHVVDNYLVVAESIAADIEDIEERVFAPRTALDSEVIYLLKREVLELRRAVAPLAEPVHRLAEGCSKLIPTEIQSYFRDVDDHLTTVAERVAAFDELLTTLVNATLAKISLQQNTDMRKITAWAGIISVPTMVAGIYGMNFDTMPELRWTYGYPIVLVTIFTICVALYRIFRRNRWL
jgi:magnesium transporter